MAGYHRRSFISQLKSARAIQERIFREHLKKSRDTVYGREKHLSAITSLKDFQKNIPIQTYEDYLPYIERLKRGEKNVLFPEKEKLIMFALSSGTTASPKFIPVTSSFFNSYRRGSLYWGALMFLSYPELLDGVILPIVSSWSESKTERGVPCGGISGLIARSQRRVARSQYCLPASVYDIKDIEDKYYTILRLGLAEPGVRFISSANPSTLITLARYADKWKEDLITDIAGGSPPYLSPDKKRAKELDQIVRREGKLNPSSFWPNLYLISCWKGGTVGQYLPLLKEYYGQVPVYDLGLLASEGRMSIPIGNDNHQGVLDIQSHFYEFIPEEEEDNPLSRALLMGELEKGKRYFIILTTSSGFFRYHIHDLIEVVDFYEGVPVIAFLNKGRHISSLTGEKLTEFQVSRAMEKIGFIKGEEWTLLPCWDNQVPYYALVAEEPQLKSLNSKEIVEQFDDELKNLNLEYKSKRYSRRLGDIRLISVPAGTFSKIKKELVERQGGRMEQYKQVHLDVDKKIRPYIEELL